MNNVYLVGLDGSDTAKRAARYAAEQAAGCGAKLIVAHVVDWSGYGFSGPEELEKRHKKKEEEIARAQADIIAPVLSDIGGMDLEIETIIHHGDPDGDLLKLCKEHSVTHIYLGRHGQTRLEDLLFGSTTNRIAQTASVPVTVVP